MNHLKFMDFKKSSRFFLQKHIKIEKEKKGKRGKIRKREATQEKKNPAKNLKKKESHNYSYLAALDDVTSMTQI